MEAALETELEGCGSWEMGGETEIKRCRERQKDEGRDGERPKRMEPGESEMQGYGKRRGEMKRSQRDEERDDGER